MLNFSLYIYTVDEDCISKSTPKEEKRLPILLNPEKPRRLSRRVYLGKMKFSRSRPKSNRTDKVTVSSDSDNSINSLPNWTSV